MSQPLIVTAAIIEKEGKFLITQRLPDAKQGGMWEFPGGKLEADESPQDALKREIGEELGVELEVGEIFEVIHHRYEWGAVLLLAYRGTLGNQPLQHLEVADHRWILPRDFNDYSLLPADLPLVKKILPSNRNAFHLALQFYTNEAHLKHLQYFR